MQITPEGETLLLESLHSSRLVGGFTHNFYRYPARMSPELAREIISLFTQPGDVVLDPFVGGGTVVVEAVAAGRRAIGIDVNSLATFVTDVKTTPLSLCDESLISQWASELDFGDDQERSLEAAMDPYTRNLPVSARMIFGRLVHQVQALPYARQQRFARCCLLRLGQWAIDGKDAFPSTDQLRDKLMVYTQEMIDGMHKLVETVGNHSVSKNDLRKRRIILQRSSVGVHEDERLQPFLGKPALVITSPPYPSVHVLYHRWQVAGRRETPAPYWFIGSADGQSASYYTLGSRSILGTENYFRSISAVYGSVKCVAQPQAPVVQLVSFSDVGRQLPAFLQAMERAGYEEIFPLGSSRTDLWRTVPNRQWYNRVSAARGAAQELLLFHVPRM